MTDNKQEIIDLLDRLTGENLQQAETLLSVIERTQENTRTDLEKKNAKE